MPKTSPNKSAFIRTMPAAHPSEIVKAAEAQGIKLTPSFVYAIRAMDKQRSKGGKGGKAKPEKGRKAKETAPTPSTKKAAPRALKPAADGGMDLRHQFVAIAMRIGTDEAQRLLDRIVDVQTPLDAVKR